MLNPVMNVEWKISYNHHSHLTHLDLSWGCYVCDIKWRWHKKFFKVLSLCGIIMITTHDNVWEEGKGSEKYFPRRHLIHFSRYSWMCFEERMCDILHIPGKEFAHIVPIMGTIKIICVASCTDQNAGGGNCKIIFSDRYSVDARFTGNYLKMCVRRTREC